MANKIVRKETKMKKIIDVPKTLIFKGSQPYRLIRCIEEIYGEMEDKTLQKAVIRCLEEVARLKKEGKLDLFDKKE